MIWGYHYFSKHRYIYIYIYGPGVFLLCTMGFITIQTTIWYICPSILSKSKYIVCYILLDLHILFCVHNYVWSLYIYSSFIASYYSTYKLSMSTVDFIALFFFTACLYTCFSCFAYVSICVDVCKVFVHVFQTDVWLFMIDSSSPYVVSTTEI